MNEAVFYYNGKAIKSIGLFGIGKSNLAVYRYLIGKYPDLSVTVRASAKSDIKDIRAKRIFFGEECFFDIREDILFLSPSARRDVPELIEASARGVILSSDTEFFFSLSDSDVYAVTGSDGKSTTTHLTSLLLSKDYGAVIPAANSGEPLTPHLDDIHTAFVAELSSFQLMYETPHSVRALITNISENHLNWHKSYREYILAKSNILPNARERVLNYDSEIIRGLFEDYEAFGVYSRAFSYEKLKVLRKAEIYLTLRDGCILLNGAPILNTSDIRLPGIHNVENFMAAIALSLGHFDDKLLSDVAKEFSGLEHRRELVISDGGVDYYNSSIDSSPKRCVNTLNTFSERVVLILGGRSKGLDFSELIPTAINKARKIILTGEASPEIERAFLENKDYENSGVKLFKFPDFYDAIDFAMKIAEPGECVLLSPAATSYDAFRNFEERGRAFKDYIKKRKNKGT